MKITQTTYFNQLTPDTDFSLYNNQALPLYSDCYFCKKMYCPKTMTLEKAQQLYGQIADSQIDKLPVRPVNTQENSNE